MDRNGRQHGHRLGIAYQSGKGRASAWGFAAHAWGALESSPSIPQSRYQAGGAELEIQWNKEKVRLGAGISSQLLRSDTVDRAQLGPSFYVAWTPHFLRLTIDTLALFDLDGVQQISTVTHLTWPLKTSFSLGTQLGLGKFEDGSWVTAGAEFNILFSPRWSASVEYRGSRESFLGSRPIWGHYGGAGIAYRWSSSSPAALLALARQYRSEEVPRHPTLHKKKVLVRISVQAPEDQTLTLVGDFNQWGEGIALRYRGPELEWEIELHLPPGRYVYQLRQDGVLKVPKGAQAYAPDDFGGENAVLLVGSQDLTIGLSLETQRIKDNPP